MLFCHKSLVYLVLMIICVCTTQTLQKSLNAQHEKYRKAHTKFAQKKHWRPNFETQTHQFSNPANVAAANDVQFYAFNRPVKRRYNLQSLLTRKPQNSEIYAEHDFERNASITGTKDIDLHSESNYNSAMENEIRILRLMEELVKMSSLVDKEVTQPEVVVVKTTAEIGSEIEDEGTPKVDKNNSLNDSTAKTTSENLNKSTTNLIRESTVGFVNEVQNYTENANRTIEMNNLINEAQNATTSEATNNAAKKGTALADNLEVLLDSRQDLDEVYTKHEVSSHPLNNTSTLQKETNSVEEQEMSKVINYANVNDNKNRINNDYNKKVELDKTLVNEENAINLIYTKPIKQTVKVGLEDLIDELEAIIDNTSEEVQNETVNETDTNKSLEVLQNPELVIKKELDKVKLKHQLDYLQLNGPQIKEQKDVMDRSTDQIDREILNTSEESTQTMLENGFTLETKTTDQEVDKFLNEALENYQKQTKQKVLESAMNTSSVEKDVFVGMQNAVNASSVLGNESVFINKNVEEIEEAISSESEGNKFKNKNTNTILYNPLAEVKKIDVDGHLHGKETDGSFDKINMKETFTNTENSNTAYLSENIGINETNVNETFTANSTIVHSNENIRINVTNVTETILKEVPETEMHSYNSSNVQKIIINTPLTNKVNKIKDYLVANKAIPNVNMNASIQNTQMSNNSNLALSQTVKKPMNSMDFAIKAIEKNITAIDIVNGTNLITDKSSNNFMKISDLTINSLSDKNNLLHAANYEDNINSTEMNAAVMVNDFKDISSNKNSATTNLKVNNFDIKSNLSEKMEDLFTTIATPIANGTTLVGNVTWSSATNPIEKVINEASVELLEGNTKSVTDVNNSSTKLEEEIVAISYTPTLKNTNQTNTQLSPSEKVAGINKSKVNNITSNAQYQQDSLHHNLNISADIDVDMSAIHKISAMLDTTATLSIPNVLNLNSIIEDLKQIQTTTQINSNEQLQIPNIAVTDNISSTNGPTTDSTISNKPAVQKNGPFYPVVRDKQQNHLVHVTTEHNVTLPINSIAPTTSIAVGSHIQYAKNNSEPTEFLSPVGNPLKLPVTYATVGIEQTNENGTLVTNTSVTTDKPSTTVISTTEKELEHLASLIEKYIMEETSNIESSELIEQQQSTASANDKAAASKIHLKNDGNANINTSPAPSLSTIDKNNKNIIMTAAIKAENRNDTEKHNKTILKKLREEVTSTVNCYTNTDVTDLAATSDSAATIKDEKSSIETIKDNDTVGNDNVENDNNHTLQQEQEDKVDYIDVANDNHDNDNTHDNNNDNDDNDNDTVAVDIVAVEDEEDDDKDDYDEVDHFRDYTYNINTEYKHEPANVKEMPYKDINVLQVHKKNSDSITRTSGKEMETNKMSTIENEKESIDISSEDNKQTYDTQNDKNQKNNDDNAFSNNLEQEQPNMSHDINQDDTEFGSGDDSVDSDDEDDNKKSYYTSTFDNTVARNSYSHLLSSAKSTKTELPNISVNSAKNSNNKSFELKKNQNQFNSDNDTTSAQFHIENSSPISDSDTTTQYSSSSDKRIKSQAEIAPTNWWRTLPYAEIRKFLNTIFDSAAEELYEEIARKSKEIRKGHKLTNQEESLDATLTHKTNSENGGFWSYLFSR